MTGNSRIYGIILLVLLAISGVLFLLFLFGSDPDTAARETYISILLTWCYILAGLAALAAVVFPVIGIATNFKAARNSLIGVGALVLIFVIGWAMASGGEYKVGTSVVSDAVVRRSEAGLITFYALMVISVVAIIYSEISKALK